MLPEQIHERLVKISRLPLSHEEKDVMRALLLGHKEHRKITQRDIASSINWMGAHEKFESQHSETTMRKVRQVIRDLRVNHKAPILSDKDGYWIPFSIGEANIYLERMARMAKSQADAWFETYESMKDSLGITNEFFEKQLCR